MTKILQVGMWEVREMVLTKEKVERIWKLLQDYRTLFSDLTRGDYNAWVQYITDPNTYWLEIYGEKDLVGVVYFEQLNAMIDFEGHMMFFDRRPAEKKEVLRELLKFMFARFDLLNRITLNVPKMYYATRRLALAMSFVEEGTKREAVMIGGKWCDLISYGILRRQVNVWTNRENQDSRERTG